MSKEDLVKLVKNKNNLILIVIIIIGIAFMMFTGGDREKRTTRTEEKTATEEERLAAILSDIKGAGEVSVMVTYYGTAEKDIAYETKTSSVGRESQSEESEDKKAVMTDGEPMIVREVYPEVKGVIVTAEGADSAYVRQAISEAVSAALNVPAHRVCIYKKEE